MSATSQAAAWPAIAYSAPILHPVYRCSGQAASIQQQALPGEVFPNQYQAQITCNPSQGFAVTQMVSPNPYASAQVNQAAMSCSPEPTHAGYQRMCQVTSQTGHMTALQQIPHGSQVQAQAKLEVPYTASHVLVPSLGQYNAVSDMSLRQIQLNNGIQHEPCIHTLSKLESDVGLLKKQSVQQRLEIKRLEHKCKRKDTTISILKQQMSWKECKMNKLIEDCKKKDILLESLTETAGGSKKIEMPKLDTQEGERHHENNKYLTEKSNDAMMKEIDRLRIENKDVNRLQNKLCKLELDPEEVKRAREENLSQRRTIASLKQKLQTFDERSVMCSASSSRDLASCVESSSG